MAAPASVKPRYKENLVDSVLAAEPALLTSLDFGQGVHQGMGNGPSLLIGDQSEVALFTNMDDTHLDYRMFCFAERGDIVVVRSRDLAFETYLDEVVGLSGARFLEASPNSSLSVAEQAVSFAPLSQVIEEAVATSKELTLNSYLTTNHTWRLAQHLARVCNSEIHVCGPSPRLSHRINNKLWFADLANKVLGRNATPPIKSAFGPAAAAGLVAYFAKCTTHVVIKVPDSAGSAGNIVLNSADLRNMRLMDIRFHLIDLLKALGWAGRYPVLIGVWDEGVSSSPSVQLWIPHQIEGAPVADGVFEQHVQGAQGTFIGAARSTLPQGLLSRLKKEALQIASVLQQLGYYGRCSLDAVICEDGGATPNIHWIECNGRWGGVSIPMSLAAKLQSTDQSKGLLILQDVRTNLVAMNTGKFLGVLDDILFHPGRSKDGVILLSPPHTKSGLSINLLVLAESQSDALKFASVAMKRLETAALA